MNNSPIDEAKLTEIARLCAATYGQEHGYTPRSIEDTNWQPHPWVIEAMKAAIRSQPAPALPV